MRPPRPMNSAGEQVFTGMTGASPSRPPNETLSPTLQPYAGIRRTAVVFVLTTPMAISSAMIPEITSAGVSPGIAIMSRPTEQTAVIASSFSRLSACGFDHSGVFGNRDECTGESADMR